MHNKILPALLAFSLFTNLPAQDFSLTQKELIASQTQEILESFRNYGRLSEDGRKISVVYLNRFSNLFNNTTSVFVYNDIDPEKLMAEYITVGEYILKVQTWYETGLDINLNWNISLISEPILVGPDNKYAVTIITEKQVMGIYKSKKIHTVTNDLYCVIEFNRNKSTLENFKIAGIQKEKPDLKPFREEETVTTVKKSNVNLSLNFQPSFTKIYSNKIFNNDYWQAEGQTGYAAGIGLTLPINPFLGVYTGLGISNYNTFLSLDTFVNHSNTNELIDKDDDRYYRYIEAGHIAEDNSLIFIEIPLGINYTMYMGERLGAYINAGVHISFLVSGKFEVTGISSHTGYYPDYHVLLYDLPEYDFTTENIDKKDDWVINPLNLSSFIELGMTMKLTDLLSFQIGPILTMGLTDLKYDTPKHRDDFISTIGLPGKTFLQSWGINTAISFKL